VLNVATLIAEARRRAGLDDFGEDSFREGLERLVDSVNRESRMSAFGAAAFPEVLIHALVNRLEIEDWYRRHPEIDGEEIVAPVFIVGLPRTGSTLLSYQLSLDPCTRSFRLWESEKPCPPPIAAENKTDPRIAEANARHDLFVKACPAVASMAPYDPSGPVECYELFYMSFDYAHYDMFIHCPSYTEWFMDPARDHTAAYRYHKRALKLLQWRCPPKRWCLKMPSHSLMIENLDTVYPDARFVMTHRDPVKVISSTTHLNVTVRQEFLEDPMTRFFGEQTIRTWDTALNRLLGFRSRNEARFFDIFHAEQLIDAVPQLIKLYNWLDWPLTDPYIADVKAWRKSNPKGDNPYVAEDFGLDPVKLRARFAYYTQRFLR
jgi:hypothetical protein